MRVPDIVPKCVAFLMYQPKGGEELSYAGTCLLVQYPISTPRKVVNYMVTAHHVIAKIVERSADGMVYIRANVKGGDVVTVASHAHVWLRHPHDSSVDVAACMWQPKDAEGNAVEMDLIPVSTELFATTGKIREHDIGIGDDVFITGLFSRFVGNARNLPVVRMGNIALVPDEKVPTKTYGLVEAILVELRSVGGLSGSPVFAYTLGPRLVSKEAGGIRQGGLFMLLGLMHGHWDTPAEGPKLDGAFDGERLNVGIGIVVPAQKILDTLDHSRFKEIRSEIETTGKSMATF